MGSSDTSGDDNFYPQKTPAMYRKRWEGAHLILTKLEEIPWRKSELELERSARALSARPGDLGFVLRTRGNHGESQAGAGQNGSKVYNNPARSMVQRSDCGGRDLRLGDLKEALQNSR